MILGFNYFIKSIFQVTAYASTKTSSGIRVQCGGVLSNVSCTAPAKKSIREVCFPSHFTLKGCKIIVHFCKCKPSRRIKWSWLHYFQRDEAGLLHHLLSKFLATLPSCWANKQAQVKQFTQDGLCPCKGPTQGLKDPLTPVQRCFSGIRDGILVLESLPVCFHFLSVPTTWCSSCIVGTRSVFLNPVRMSPKPSV